MKEEKKESVVSEKPYFHELPQEAIDKLVEEERKVQYIVDNFKQPKWCGMPEALNFYKGCYSLANIGANSRRKEISEEFCKDCDCFLKDDE